MRGFLRKSVHVRPLGLFSVAVIAIITAFFSVFTPFSPASALTTAPQRINFQGRLSDASGNMVANGLYNMKFALYDAASAGTLKWSETRETTNRVQVTNGLFNVKLGDVAAFTDPTIFSGGALYFEITLANPATATCSTASCQTWESPMSRSQLATSAYAFNSETLDGLDSTDFVRNQNASAQSTTNFWLSGTGRADTALQAPAHDTATAVALTIGGTNASSITMGRANLAGTITLGNSTVTNTIAIGSAAGNAATQTITIGASATAGSTTNVTIGSTIAGTTILQGNVRVSAQTTNGFVKTSGGNGALSVASSIALGGTDVSGTLGVSNGGTGVTGAPTNGQLLIGNGTTYTRSTLSGTGISVTNGVGTIGLAALYGSAANTAVRGNTTLLCPSGTGNLSGTGNTITLGTGGTCTALNTVMNPNFTTSVTTPSLYTSTLDTASAITLSIGTANATSIALNKDTTIAAGRSLNLAGGTTASRPASPTEGMVYYDTTTKQLLVYANGKWQADGKEAVVVAASNSSAADKASADYIAAGANADQVAINNALTAANPAGAGRKTGKVILLAGTYTANATILIPNNTTLAGVGAGTLIQLADIDATDNLIENSDTTTGTGISIQSLRLDGQKNLNTIGTQQGIYLNNMGTGHSGGARPGGKITAVTVSNFRDSGIYMNASSNNTISGVTAQGNNHSGMYIVGSNNNTINGSIAQGNTNSGFYITASSNNSLSGNFAQGNANSGFLLNVSTSNTLTGNTAQGNTNAGFNLDVSSNNTITGNSAQGNATAGFYFNSSPNNTVASNGAQANTTGFYLNASPANTLTANTIVDSNNYGVYLLNSSNNTISGTGIHNSGGGTANNAIYAENADTNVITGNTITDTSATGTNYAINFFNGTSDQNYLSDNRFNSTPGTSTINDAGTGTVYANQPRAENGGRLTTRMANDTQAFTIQNAAGANVLAVDTSNARLYVGPTSGDTTGAVLVLGNKTNEGDPTGVEGAMYYSSAMKSFRCYRDGAWLDCGTRNIEREWLIEDEFFSGKTIAGDAMAGGAEVIEPVGEHDWCYKKIGGGGSSGSTNNTQATTINDHPGILSFHSKSTSVGGVLSLDGCKSGSLGTIKNTTFKTSVGADVTDGRAAVFNAGMFDFDGSTAADPTSGAWWRYDSANTYWKYCYHNNSAVTCADSTVTTASISPTAFTRLEIRVDNALPTGNTSSITFIINGISHNVPNTNIRLTDGSGSLAPSFSFWSKDTVWKAFYVDYVQVRGVSDAAR